MNKNQPNQFNNRRNGTGNTPRHTPTQSGATRPIQNANVNPSYQQPLRSVPDVSKSEEIIKVRKKRKKQNKGKKAALIVLAVILGLVAVVGVASALYINSLSKAISFDDIEAEDALREALTAVESKDSPYYTLLLGSDAREGETVSRSDVIILLRVDPSDATLTMVSIPRDTMVEIPGHGTQKINAAYAFGGAAGAVESVSNFAGVPIAHYAEIHFQELEELVDMLGGVWVDVPIASDNIAAGEQLLDGSQALVFARDRYSFGRGDFQRSDHQRILLEAIIKKILDSSVIELPGLVQKTASCATTDYSINDIVDLALAFQGADKMTVYSCMAPSYSQMVDGISYVITEYPGWTEMMQRVDAGYDPKVEESSEGSSDYENIVDDSIADEVNES